MKGVVLPTNLSEHFTWYKPLLKFDNPEGKIMTDVFIAQDI